MNDARYKKSFDLFLKRTDEKFVIREFIYKNIPIHKNMDFLDIGGGDGELAFPISEKVRTTFIIEPNYSFYKKLIKHKKIRVLNEKWEDVCLNMNFDLILALYVVTYFSQKERKKLIKKMYELLRPGGCILILSVDSKKGSWRKIHTYFYKLMNYHRNSSDDNLKKIVREYGAISKSFKTHVIAKDTDEMLNILGFDFYKYPESFLKFSRNLIKFLKKHSNDKGKIILEIVHNAHIIIKK